MEEVKAHLMFLMGPIYNEGLGKIKKRCAKQSFKGRLTNLVFLGDEIFLLDTLAHIARIGNHAFPLLFIDNQLSKRAVKEILVIQVMIC
jgi:hypothetical protein